MVAQPLCGIAVLCSINVAKELVERKLDGRRSEAGVTWSREQLEGQTVITYCSF
jgi:hypothetical protein